MDAWTTVARAGDTIDFEAEEARVSELGDEQ